MLLLLFHWTIFLCLFLQLNNFPCCLLLLSFFLWFHAFNCMLCVICLFISIWCLFFELFVKWVIEDNLSCTLTTAIMFACLGHISKCVYKPMNSHIFFIRVFINVLSIFDCCCCFSACLCYIPGYRRSQTPFHENSWNWILCIYEYLFEIHINVFISLWFLSLSMTQIHFLDAKTQFVTALSALFSVVARIQLCVWPLLAMAKYK